MADNNDNNQGQGQQTQQQTFTPNPQPVRQPMRDTTTYEERGFDQSGLTKKKQQQ